MLKDLDKYEPLEPYVPGRYGTYPIKYNTLRLGGEKQYENTKDRNNRH